MIQTARLVLRRPEDGDRAALLAMNADPRVAEWLAGPLTAAQNDALIAKIQAHIDEKGYGFWAAERKADGQVVGLAGLLTMGEDLPPGPALEIGWRFAAEAWGQGFATEAASAALAWAFANTDAPEVVAITARTNLRSQGVMRRIGMSAEPWRDFDHPRVPDGSPLKAHVTFAAKRLQGPDQ
jgi:RimJ/RimL family protein N-acetyltransferase